MIDNIQKNIFWHNSLITRQKREKNNKHKSIVIWFTGLSGSGKSSIANYLEKQLFKNGVHTYLLDGDNIRSGLCSDLTFSVIDRKENVRRIGEVVKIMLDAGMITLVSVISPYRNQREIIYNMLGGVKNFLEVFVDTPISVCESRDPKKLYRKARTGEISDFTGVQFEYEIPNNPSIILNGTDSLDINSKKIINLLYKNNIISFC
ncbi:adenylyl-sulfate kinase [Buchnera aphidicola]|uniref:Adenylyl-sulfate kinase n=1 Tax=Buchnera aphidicola str. Ua (Uroleucon ambrosiae) TaxID=1005057 RepID=G2LPR4_BUCUM|nr:adenylyl-sulfate kinase [Buchnera aphidicola]AEO08201.1 adenylylsulfate kinase [Buchnera aphidicola str. Ua (Uroleucon ambrosiae)]